MTGFLFLLVAAGLLMGGAELFVENASAAGRRLGTTAMTIGLLVAGAEPEELITAVTAAMRDRGAIAAGDAIGANVTLLTLVLGLVAVIRPIEISTRIRRYLLGVCALGGLSAFLLLDAVTRSDGVVLILAFLVAVALVWRLEGGAPKVGELAEQDLEHEGRPGLAGLLLALAGVAIMAGGGSFAVIGAERIVDSLGLSDAAVGLGLVALATTSEMLALAFAAARRQIHELAIAGVVGSVAYNATVTLGAAALVRPLVAPGVRAASWVAAALPLLILVVTGRGRLGRLGGGALLAGYAAYLVWLYR